MRRFALLAAALAAACSQEPRRAFPVGMVGPVTPRVAAEAGRLGLELTDTPSRTASVVSAGVPGATPDGTEIMASWQTLRFLAAQAAVKGAAGVFFRLPAAPAGHDLLDYPEEWQAPARVIRELQAMHPVFEHGVDVPAPFAVPPGAEARVWSYRGRRYALLVNPSGSDTAFDADAFAGWRTLFEVRSDARRILKPCGVKFCLPSERALWLEGRLSW
jgi:hypothetical protein